MVLHYRPLVCSQNEFRLLELLPQANKEQKLIPTCRIFHACLLNRPRYVALSYVWGDTKNNRVILVGDAPILVTHNLYDAMMALRPVEEPLVIWIDFLCINQANDEEKSWQVNLMKDIYLQAEQVLAWLGPADSDSDIVMDHLSSFGAKAEACGIHMGPHVCQDVWRKLASEVSDPHRQTQSNLVMTTPGGSIGALSQKILQCLFFSISGWHEQENLVSISALRRLLTRPWWGRIWVLQEIALPDSAELVCGTKRITRSKCSAAVNAYYAWWLILMQKARTQPKSLTRYQLQATMQLSFHRPNLMLSAWRLHRYDRFPLAALLRSTCVGSINLRRHGPHNLESTDPRDKIFALLGLAADRDDLKRRGVFPDYSKSCRDVYTSTMVALLHQGHISLLSFCQAPKIQHDLPSWVPDWSRSTTNMLQDVENDHVTTYPKFSASGVKPSHLEITVIRRNEAIEGISLLGYLYDEIFDAASFPIRVSSHEVPVNETYSWPSRWLVEFLRLTYRNQRTYANFEDRLLAVARSSIGDVGLNQTAELARLGDDRFLDAAILLHYGIEYIRDTRIKLQVQRFLANKAIKKSIKGRTPAHTKLNSDIIGKSLGRLPFITSKGHLVLGYEYVRQGDLIALISGTEVPFVLRRQNEKSYRLIGEVYVDGIMDETLHMFGNADMKIVEAGVIEAVWSMEDMIIFRNTGGLVRSRGGGYYTEKCVFREGDWWLSHLALHRTYMNLSSLAAILSFISESLKQIGI